MPVLTIDYTVIGGTPSGNASVILSQIGAAVAYLAGNATNKVYIMGDSSGGGSALQAMVAQVLPLCVATQHLLQTWQHRQVRMGCQRQGQRASRVGYCSAPGSICCATPQRMSALLRHTIILHINHNNNRYATQSFGQHGGNYLLGDINFGTGSIAAEQELFAKNGAVYAGKWGPHDPRANPMLAPDTYVCCLDPKVA